jgi:hypothetical protein
MLAFSKADLADRASGYCNLLRAGHHFAVRDEIDCYQPQQQ